MPTPDQRAGVRPISFIFHNTGTGAKPIEYRLVVRPEDLTRSDVSRLATHQTLGGAWIDNFGQGLPTVQISGTTGWGQGGLPNGQAAFEALHQLIYVDWHNARKDLVRSGKNPDLVKLIFSDMLDDFIWVVAPLQFVLRRSRSRPLLSQYSINLSYVSGDVRETVEALNLLKAQQVQVRTAALSSLDQSLMEINDFANNLSAEITSVLGVAKDAVVDLVKVTATVLNATRSVLSAGMTVVDSVTGNLMDIATGLAISASNVFATITAVQAMPGRVMARLVRVKTLFMNAYCVLSNTFKPRQTLPNFEDVYGASMCSSTAGGRPLSKYLNSNTMEAISPVIRNQIAVTGDAVASMMHLNRMDVALNPESIDSIGALSRSVANGVVVV